MKKLRTPIAVFIIATALLFSCNSSETFTPQTLISFRRLQNTLNNSVEKLEMNNKEMALQLTRKIETEISQGNQMHAFILNEISMIQEKTRQPLNFIASLEKKLNEFGAFDEMTKELNHAGEHSLNQEFWKSGKASELQKKLNEYTVILNETSKKFPLANQPFFQSPALEPKDDYSITSPKAKEISWEEYSFSNRPVIADLAFMADLKLSILNMEEEMIQIIENSMNIEDWPMDSIVIMDCPKSQIVTAGETFETTLFVTKMSKYIFPEFSSDETIITGPGGQTGVLKIPTTNNFPAGANEKTQTYSAKAIIERRDGSKMELYLRGSFTVKKP